MSTTPTTPPAQPSMADTPATVRNAAARSRWLDIIATINNRRRTPIDVAIVRDITSPLARAEIERGIRICRRWRAVSVWCEGLAHLSLGLVSVLSFVQAYVGHEALTIVTGLVSTLAIVLLKYSTYASHECAESHEVVKGMLKYLHADPLPELMGHVS